VPSEVIRCFGDGFGFSMHLQNFPNRQAVTLFQAFRIAARVAESFTSFLVNRHLDLAAFDLLNPPVPYAVIHVFLAIPDFFSIFFRATASLSAMNTKRFTPMKRLVATEMLLGVLVFGAGEARNEHGEPVPFGSSPCFELAKHSNPAMHVGGEAAISAIRCVMLSSCASARPGERNSQ
jgi:hypothetical protein